MVSKGYLFALRRVTSDSMLLVVVVASSSVVGVDGTRSLSAVGVDDDKRYVLNLFTHACTL